MKNKVKAVVFDYDDTLVKTRETVWQAHMITAKKFYGMEMTEEIIRKHWGKPFKEMMLSMYNQTDSFENLSKNYMAVRQNYPMQVFDESVSVVSKLVDRCPVGIVTSASLDLVMFDMKVLPFPHQRLAFIQTADDTPVHKPDPKVFEPAINKLAKKNINPEEVLYVGDDERDYLAAKGAGLQFVGIVRNSINPFSGFKFKVIHNLVELLDLV